MKNPQAFVAEQAQLVKGVDLSPKAKTPAAAMGGYVLVPESDAQKADSAKLKWHEQENQVTQAQRLDEMGQKAGNLVGLYKDLTTKPPAGINSAVLKNYTDNLKATIVGEMQKRFPDMSPEVAWAKAQENSSLWDVGSEFWHQGTAAFAQLAPVFAQSHRIKSRLTLSFPRRYRVPPMPTSMRGSPNITLCLRNREDRLSRRICRERRQDSAAMIRWRFTPPWSTLAILVIRKRKRINSRLLGISQPKRARVIRG